MLHKHVRERATEEGSDRGRFFVVKKKTIQNWIFIDLFTLFMFSVAFLLISMSYTEYIETIPFYTKLWAWYDCVCRYTIHKCCLLLMVLVYDFNFKFLLINIHFDIEEGKTWKTFFWLPPCLLIYVSEELTFKMKHSSHKMEIRTKFCLNYFWDIPINSRFICEKVLVLKI